MFHEPSEINVKECWSAVKPPRPLTARSLVEVDEELSNDNLPLYWSCNTFKVLRGGLEAQILIDESYDRLLQFVVLYAGSSIRRLKFLQVSNRPSLDMLHHLRFCIGEVEIDLKRRTVEIWIRLGGKCTCPHAGLICSRMNTILAQMPQVEKPMQLKSESARLRFERLRPLAAALWDLHECWYCFHPVQDQLRSWDDYRRHEREEPMRGPGP